MDELTEAELERLPSDARRIYKSAPNWDLVTRGRLEYLCGELAKALEKVAAAELMAAIFDELQWDEYGQCRCGAMQGENHDCCCRSGQALAAWEEASK